VEALAETLFLRESLNNFKKGIKMSAFTKEELKKILDDHQLWINDSNTGTRANLYGANLYGANLTRANLTRANLYGANLTRANLTRANLDGANLDGANLTRANLYGANLYGANLTRANLTRANLYGANLYGANLTRANLTRANLYGANLDGANLDGANLDGANLDGANLTRANLDGADYSAIYEDFMAKLALQKTEVVGLFKALLDGRVDGSTYSGECACFVGTLANVKGCSYSSLTVKAQADSPTERFFLAIRKGDTPENNRISEIVACWIMEFLLENEDLEIPHREVVWS
jgi:uncharacterized protein YjbI with pentapeptide repeats